MAVAPLLEANRTSSPKNRGLEKYRGAIVPQPESCLAVGVALPTTTV
jgi:hypothetical protein